MNITDHFFAMAAKHPQRTAIIDRDGKTLSFAGLAAEVKMTAAWYRSLGIGRGDRVLVFVPMGIPLYRCILALFRIGAVAVFLDEWVSKERMELCCRIAGCKALVAPFKLRLLSLLSKELRRIPIRTGPEFQKSAADSNAAVMQENETALITFTTGSTGIPKAADRTHGFLQAQFDALVHKIAPKENDIDMPVLPIVLLLNLGTGVPSVIADFNPRKPETIEPLSIWKQIEKYQVNRLTASPFVVEKLAGAQCPNKSSMRIFTGGAPVFPGNAAAMLAGLPGSTLEIVYGSTEAEPISSISASRLVAGDFISAGGLDVGLPYSGTQVMILPLQEGPFSFSKEEEMKAQEQPAFSIGEITVSGEHVLAHYISNPEAERQNKIYFGKKTWHRTGDAGFRDESGRLFLCGRCNTLIRREGKLIAPFLWEGWLCSLPGIAMGTVQEINGQILIVIEKKSSDVQPETIAAIKEKMPGGIIRFLEKIPRDPRHFSKIDYAALGNLLMG